MRSSVRARITLVATAVVGLALVCAAWFIIQLVENDLIDATERALEAELELEAARFGIDTGPVFVDFVIDDRPLSFSLFTIAEEGLAFGELYERGVYVADVLIDPSTTELVEIIDPFTGKLIDDPELVEGLSDVALGVQEVENEMAEGQSLLVGAAARDEVDEYLDAVRSALTLIVPILTVVMGALIWFLVGRSLRPVGAMSARVDAISTTSLDQRVPVPDGRDEIANLATVMNGMLDRLERGDRRQREFAADASHELRSPLSSVRAAAELIETKSEGQRSASLASEIVAEADRMNDLIGDLLQLSRLDEGRSTEEFEPVDLHTLASAVVDQHDGVRFDSPEGCDVDGSPGQLERVIDNLLTNALRHADSKVTMQLTRTKNGWVELCVDDDGPGVPVADRERIFERFSRLDEARTRRAGGFGLGLALVQAIVHRHGGEVFVETSPTLGGASFVVRLPSSRQQP